MRPFELTQNSMNSALSVSRSNFWRETRELTLGYEDGKKDVKIRKTSFIYGIIFTLIMLVLDLHHYNFSMGRWSNLDVTAIISKRIKKHHINRLIAVPGGRAIINTMEPINLEEKIYLVQNNNQLHLQSLNTTGLDVSAYISTDNYLYTVEREGLITKISLDSQFNQIKTFQLNGPVNVLSACLFSETKLLINVYRDHCFEMCSGELLIYNMETRTHEVVLLNEYHPYLLSCKWNNNCIAVKPRDANNKAPLYIYRYNKKNWKKHILKVHQKIRPSYGRHFGWLDMTDYGTFLIPDPDEYKLTEYSSNGEFLRNLITKSDGYGRPMYVSYDHPYLWVVFNKGDPSEYNSFNDILLKFTVKAKDN